MNWFTFFPVQPQTRPRPPSNWLGVQVLTEFVFCPRAGLIELANLTDDSGSDLPEVRDFVPRYDRQRLQAELDRTMPYVWLGLAGLLTSVGITNGAVLLSLDWGIVCGAVVTAGMAGFLGYFARRALALWDCLRAAQKAEPIEPAVPLAAVEVVQWWDLLQAGFVSKEYDVPLEAPTWFLCGKPWRVLCKGDLRIPVFLQRHPLTKLYPQHYVRIAAYCALIEAATELRAPYGIVLRGSDYLGWAIPYGVEEQNRLQMSLAMVRDIIRADAAYEKIPPPPPALCAHCHHGCPVRVQSETITFGRDGQLLPIFPLPGRDRERFHSPCGDRFRWQPPHARSQLVQRPDRI